MFELSYTEDMVNRMKTLEGAITRAMERNDLLTAENAALREQLRWIPVSERLPEYGQDVLAYYGNDAGDDYYGVAWINPTDDDKWCAYPDNPTHWLPIPPFDISK